MALFARNFPIIDPITTKSVSPLWALIYDPATECKQVIIYQSITIQRARLMDIQRALVDQRNRRL